MPEVKMLKVLTKYILQEPSSGINPDLILMTKTLVMPGLGSTLAFLDA
jgi:hypothetical protein